MTHRGPFQPLLFCDSMAWGRYPSLRKVTSPHLQCLLPAAPGRPWCLLLLCTPAGFELWQTLDFPLHFHLFPSHLDNHSLWEPKIFATCCFRIIMYSIQVGTLTVAPAGDARPCLGAPTSASTLG